MSSDEVSLVNLKIRTVTLGLPGMPNDEDIAQAAKALNLIAGQFQKAGFEVQTKRLALEHWSSGGAGSVSSPRRAEVINELVLQTKKRGIDFVGIGLARNPEHIESLSSLLACHPTLRGGADLTLQGQAIDKESLNATVEAIHSLKCVRDGLGNFQFAAGFAVKQTPFFPIACHVGRTWSFSIGCENIGALVEASRQAKFIDKIRGAVAQHLNPIYKKIESVALGASSASGVHYAGLDTSIAPSATPPHSIPDVYEACGIEFGGAGSLAFTRQITEALQSAPVNSVGFRGVMFSVMEDIGLSRLAGEGRLNLTSLLALSSVCGVGIDMVPIPGDSSPDVIKRTMLDVATMSARLDKPLHVRILPIPQKEVGDPVKLDSKFLCESSIVDIC